MYCIEIKTQQIKKNEQGLISIDFRVYINKSFISIIQIKKKWSGLQNNHPLAKICKAFTKHGYTNECGVLVYIRIKKWFSDILRDINYTVACKKRVQLILNS